MNRQHYLAVLVAALPEITPFDPAEVVAIDANCGTIWIDLEDGTSWTLGFSQCEPGSESP